jgi:hypothetical protein
VTDSTGHSVFSASIAVTRTSTNEKIAATTDKDGLYSVANLSSGDYTLELTDTGFTSQRVQIKLGRGERKKRTKADLALSFHQACGCRYSLTRP